MKKLILIAVTMIMISFGNTALSQDLSDIKNQKAIKVSGGIAASGYYYNSSLPYSSRAPLGYNLSANLNINLYGISIPLYASFNNSNSKFSHPFNRFGISPTYKWAKAHIGWRNMNLSQFTLNNITFKGAGLELTPGKLRVAALHGTIEKSIALSQLNVEIPDYKRRITGFKLGIGSSSNFIDLIVMKAKDDLSSQEIPDSLESFVDASDNLAIGIKNRLSMFNRHLVFNCDIAGSIFTENIREDSLFADELKDYPWVGKLVTPSLSSNATYAGEASLMYQSSVFGLGASIRRVMPNYRSLGAAYILNDLEAVTITPMLNLMKGRMLLSGSIGIQRNNLDGNRFTTSNRNIGSVNLQLTPNEKWGVNVAYSNFTFEQQMHIDSLYNDSILINQLNHQLTITPRYTINTDNYAHNIMFMFTWQALNNANSENGLNSNSMTMGNLSYNLNMKKSKSSLSASTNFFMFDSGIEGGKVQRVGITIGGHTKVVHDKIRLNANVSFNNQQQNKQSTSYLLSNLSANYQIFKKTQIGLRLNNNMSFLSSDRRGEFSTQIQFSQRFF